jgi:periplasmic divalent cation tolerance protein
MEDYVQVVTTTETDAQAIARAVVEQRLAGCAQVVGPITSVFRWQGQIEMAEEWLCLIKSRRVLYAALEQAILEVHPYDVPEILAIPVTAGSKSYLEWLDSETRKSIAPGLVTATTAGRSSEIPWVGLSREMWARQPGAEAPHGEHRANEPGWPSTVCAQG